MTIVVAPSLTGNLDPGVTWLPDQWLAMMRGEVADLTQKATGDQADDPAVVDSSGSAT
jgi:hypothetical protein